MKNNGEYRETYLQPTRDTISLRSTRLSKKGSDKDPRYGGPQDQNNGNCAC